MYNFGDFWRPLEQPVLEVKASSFQYIMVHDYGYDMFMCAL